MNQITIDKQRVKKWQSEQKAFLKSQDSALVFGDKRQFNKTTQFVSTTKKDYPRHDLIPREKLKKKDSSDENRLKMDFSNNLQQSLSSASYPSYYIDQEKKDGTLLTFKNHQLEATRIATKAKLDRVDIGDKSLTSYLSINQATYQGKQLKQSPQDISEAIRRAAEIADYNLKGITRRKINLNEPVSSNIPQGDRNKPHCYLSTSIINFVAPASKNYATRVKKVELLTDIFPGKSLFLLFNTFIDVGDRKQDYETTNAQTFLRHQQFPIKVNPKKAVTNVFLGDQVRGPLIQAQETKKLQSIHQKDFAISQLTPTIPIKHSTFSTKKGVKDAINPANSLYQPDPIKVPVNEKQHDGDIDVNDERKFNNTKSCVPFGDFVYFDVKDHQSISHGTFIKFEQNHKPIIVKIHKNHSQFGNTQKKKIN